MKNKFNRFFRCNRVFRVYSNFAFFPKNYQTDINFINPIKNNYNLISLIGFDRKNIIDSNINPIKQEKNRK